MSGLLQRLAGQAMGAQAVVAPRIRSAMSVHAKMPMGMAPEVEESRPVSALFSEPCPPAGESTSSTQAPRGSTQFHGQERQTRPARCNDPRAPASRGERDPESSPRSHEFIEQAPRTLLEEAPAGDPPRTIMPTAQAPLTANVAPTEKRSEPTEVHVHIGRVEVIAAPEAAAPKRHRTAPARNTLPLADYLSRRRS